MGGSFVQLHLQNLLIGMVIRIQFHHISQKIGFQDCRFSAADLMFGPQPNLRLDKQFRRIGRVHQHGPHQRAHQRLRRLFVPAVGIGRFPQQRPDGQSLPFVESRADDLQPLLVPVQICGKAAEGVLQEKAHGQPGGVGRDSQNIKAIVGVQRQFVPQDGLSAAQSLHNVLQILLLHVVAEHHSGHGAAVFLFGSLRPVDQRGVAQPGMIGRLPQQVVQRLRVGEGRVGADRGVAALSLLVPVVLAKGFQRRRVETDQRRARGLRAYDTLDAGVQNGDGRFLPRDQATPHFRLFIVGIGLVPCLSDLRHILRVNAIHAENQIAALEDFFPFRGQHGVFFGGLRIPAREETQNGLCHGVIDLSEDLPMPCGAGLEAFQRAFRLALIVASENVAGILAQKIGNDPNRFFRLGRQFDQLRPLLALCIGDFQRPQALNLPFRGQF